MDRKRIQTISAFLGMLIMLTIIGTPVYGGSTKPLVLKAVSAFPASDRCCTPLMMFKSKVEQLSNGKIKIEYKGGPETIGAFDQAVAVRNGIVDISYLYNAAYEGLVPATKTFVLSLYSPDEERSMGVFDIWSKLHRKAGLVLLGRGALTNKFDFMALWLKKGIHKPQDLYGKKIGGISPLCNPFLKKMRAAPIVLPYSEIYTSLERGVVDGFWMGFVGPVRAGFMGAVKYCIEHQFYRDNLALIMNPRKWESLNEEQQGVLQKAIRMVDREGPIQMREYMGEEKQEMIEKYGIEFIRFSDSDKDYWYKNALESAWEEERKAFPEIIPRLENLLYPKSASEIKRLLEAK
jgi:TRAP-type C4-dicarboxylate transport system substrate-binding protein